MLREGKKYMHLNPINYYLNGLIEVPLGSFGLVFGNPLFSLFCTVTTYFGIRFLYEWALHSQRTWGGSVGGMSCFDILKDRKRKHDLIRCGDEKQSRDRRGKKETIREYFLPANLLCCKPSSFVRWKGFFQEDSGHVSENLRIPWKYQSEAGIENQAFHQNNYCYSSSAST